MRNLLNSGVPSREPFLSRCRWGSETLDLSDSRDRKLVLVGGSDLIFDTCRDGMLVEGCWCGGAGEGGLREVEGSLESVLEGGDDDSSLLRCCRGELGREADWR